MCCEKARAISLVSGWPLTATDQPARPCASLLEPRPVFYVDVRLLCGPGFEQAAMTQELLAGT